LFGNQLKKRTSQPNPTAGNRSSKVTGPVWDSLLIRSFYEKLAAQRSISLKEIYGELHCLGSPFPLASCLSWVWKYHDAQSSMVTLFWLLASCRYCYFCNSFGTY